MLTLNAKQTAGNKCSIYMKMNFVNVYRTSYYGKMKKEIKTIRINVLRTEPNKKKENTLINLNNIIDCLGDSGRDATE